MRLEELLSPELYSQVQAAIDQHNAAEPDKTKHVRLVDLSDGGYVSADKHNDKVNNLSQQVRDLTAQIGQRDADMADLSARLTAAQADATKLTDAQTALAGLQNKYETDRQAWEAKNAAQAYEFMIRERAGDIKFTSAAAKRDFVREAIEKQFKLDGSTLLGYTDFVEQYKAENPGAVAPDPNPNPEPPTPGVKPPKIVLPGGGKEPTKKTLSQLMSEKNANPNMVVKFD